jgi:4-amino-4-deoxy-L-arabinose transferase-like glycosyltransferase
MSTRTFVAALAALLLLAICLRAIFPTADPPWRTTVGVVWHDEGAWTHNARNRALFGQWRLDAWNPIFLAPVFTGLEYASFATFGVGTWQARLVSEVGGSLAVLLLALGVTRVGGRLAGLIAGVLLATNYVYLMYDRAAIMESTMAAFVVMSWYGFVRAQRQPVWGLLAAVAALLAYFTKAAAAFSVAALALTCVWSLIAEADGDRGAEDRPRAAAMWTLAGLCAVGVIALAVFVLPWWSEYRFYNWQMSVTRKPSYDLKSLIDRVSWFPVLHDVFTRMWPVFVIGLIAWATRVVRWRRISAPERLLVLWIGIGCAELILHDVGNERRFVFLLPAFVALTALTLARDGRLLPAEAAGWTRRRALLALPLVLYLAYLAIGPLARLAFLYDVGPSARLSGALAFGIAALLYLGWPRLMRWASTSASAALSPRVAVALTAIIAVGNLVQFGQWAADRAYKNYEASRALGRLLPPGTLVHGKLANGLSLENQIKPIFVGRGFGNYEDRLRRDDVPYVLTYVAPREGYEGPVILDVLQAYPQRRILWTVDVAETPGGHDRAALIEKGPPAVQAPALLSGRVRETH